MAFDQVVLVVAVVEIQVYHLMAAYLIENEVLVHYLIAMVVVVEDHRFVAAHPMAHNQDVVPDDSSVEDNPSDVVEDLDDVG